MLGDRGLRDPELAPDDRDDLTRGVLAVGRQELEDAPPHRVSQDVEGVHQPPV
ncbi:hypothetical protein DB32_000686 [Sandaracinus amylolyticus]|uniref:Uncharacterized protein n=1 Tax=Sandaracinus amylolyticus TaxID=927083 RepID=A0A0F6VZE8_9BACT|nr:hypothetical protein DB32_000686 [Sandaracinus amylolyticus]